MSYVIKTQNNSMIKKTWRRFLCCELSQFLILLLHMNLLKNYNLEIGQMRVEH